MTLPAVCDRPSVLLLVEEVAGWCAGSKLAKEQQQRQGGASEAGQLLQPLQLWPCIAQEVAAALEGGLQPIAAAVQRCLAFYVGTGAITARTEESLRGLLGQL